MPVTVSPVAQATALLDAALEQEIGIAFKPNSQKGAQNLLLKIKGKNLKYAGLIFFAPNNGEVFICKREVELD